MICQKKTLWETRKAALRTLHRLLRCQVVFTEICQYYHYCHYNYCHNLRFWVLSQWVFELSQFFFSFFFTIWVFKLGQNFSFFFFLILSIWVFEFCHNSSFWVLCHNLCFWVHTIRVLLLFDLSFFFSQFEFLSLSQFDFLSFLFTIWVWVSFVHNLSF